ncbi:hypothetical protein G3I60_30310 [Streptomyces sp. SID13666]|uniref:hypothetical protein n=1 Tax=unclassified Streptomyces TaxID=2593676 RepID=UPI0013BF71A7|nr:MULTISPECIES: hypothetical protein [unclassified Streptomyces]NEA58332.1 hypothetical protein [Streptomyces sp. SID13666]NEA76949.1 hypothetical protein [Streptomyces sp. SID13588]
MALAFVGRLLARHDRGAEAFELLCPVVEDRFLAASLLTTWIPTDHRCDTLWCGRGLDADTALALLTTIRERQDRTNDAIALLRTRHVTSVNSRYQVADPPATHNRIEELLAYAEPEDHGHAAQRSAEIREEHGDVEGTIAAYRQPDTSVAPTTTAGPSTRK